MHVQDILSVGLLKTARMRELTNRRLICPHPDLQDNGRNPPNRTHHLRPPRPWLGPPLQGEPHPPSTKHFSLAPRICYFSTLPSLEEECFGRAWRFDSNLQNKSEHKNLMKIKSIRARFPHKRKPKHLRIKATSVRSLRTVAFNKLPRKPASCQ